MLFKSNKELKGIESFNPKACQIEGKKSQKFDKDEVPMGCCEGCWSGCIGGPHRQKSVWQNGDRQQQNLEKRQE